MAREIQLTTDSSKTYATRENVRKAIEKMPLFVNGDDLRYIITQNAEGRFFPVFIGQSAIAAGVHFYFHVVG